MAKKRPTPVGVSPFPGATWVDLESETNVAYFYDLSHVPTLEASAMAACGGSFWEDDECPQLAERGIVLPLFYTARSREDGLHAYVYVGPPPAPALLPAKPLNAPQRGLLHLPTGKLRIEPYSAVRIGPDKPDAEGVTLNVPAGSYDVCLCQAKPVEVATGWPMLYDYVSLTPREAEAVADEAKPKARKRKASGA